MSVIIYYHSLFYNLGHGATIVISYCPIMTSDTKKALVSNTRQSETYERRATQLGLGSTRVTFLSNNSTIWHHNCTIWCHNSTIWYHNSSTMTRGQYWKILSGQYGILSQYATLLKVMCPGIDQSKYRWHETFKAKYGWD